MTETGVKCFSTGLSCIDKIRDNLIQYSGGAIICDKDESEGLATICINHPERRNAISGKMMVDFENIVNDLSSWDNGKAVLIYGAENMFCSGGDLNLVRKQNLPESGYLMSLFMQNILHKFSRLPLVSVAYISGHGALGGGAEISLFCDYRLFNSSSLTRIGFVHNKMGIVPAWGGASKLVQVVGKSRALDVLLTADCLSFSEAHNIGLVNDTVGCFEDAVKWILNKTHRDKSVVRATKSIIACNSFVTDDVMEKERQILTTVWGGVANKRALFEMNIKHAQDKII